MARKLIEESSSSSKVELDMTSMIDVVFLLLIFFMCATKFKIAEGSLRAFLPRDRGSQSSSPVITRGCRITMGWENEEAKIMVDELLVPNTAEYASAFEAERGIYGPDERFILDHIANRKATYTGLGAKGLPVIIDFSKKVPVKYVVQMLNLCHKAEIEDISFAAPEIPIE